MDKDARASHDSWMIWIRAVSSGWAPKLRRMVLFAVAAVLTGCAGDVAMQNPRTGATEICRESLRGLNPWSQTMACVANHEAQGWVRVVRE